MSFPTWSVKDDLKRKRGAWAADTPSPASKKPFGTTPAASLTPPTPPPPPPTTTGSKATSISTKPGSGSQAHVPLTPSSTAKPETMRATVSSSTTAADTGAPDWPQGRLRPRRKGNLLFFYDEAGAAFNWFPPGVDVRTGRKAGPEDEAKGVLIEFWVPAPHDISLWVDEDDTVFQAPPPGASVIPFPFHPPPPARPPPPPSSKMTTEPRRPDGRSRRPRRLQALYVDGVGVRFRDAQRPDDPQLYDEVPPRWHLDVAIEKASTAPSSALIAFPDPALDAANADQPAAWLYIDDQNRVWDRPPPGATIQSTFIKSGGRSTKKPAAAAAATDNTKTKAPLTPPPTTPSASAAKKQGTVAKTSSQSSLVDTPVSDMTWEQVGLMIIEAHEREAVHYHREERARRRAHCRKHRGTTTTTTSMKKSMRDMSASEPPSPAPAPQPAAAPLTGAAEISQALAKTFKPSPLRHEVQTSPTKPRRGAAAAKPLPAPSTPSEVVTDPKNPPRPAEPVPSWREDYVDPTGRVWKFSELNPLTGDPPEDDDIDPKTGRPWWEDEQDPLMCHANRAERGAAATVSSRDDDDDDEPVVLGKGEPARDRTASGGETLAKRRRKR